MNWMDLAAIVFASVTVNHLGLIAAVEQVIRHPLPILNCPKCLTFWSVLACGLIGDGISAAISSGLPRLFATSILCAYLAIWIELAEGFIDKLYSRIYDTLYPTADPSDADTPGA